MIRLKSIHCASKNTPLDSRAFNSSLPIFDILSLLHSAVNVKQTAYHISHHVKLVATLLCEILKIKLSKLLTHLTQ